MNDRGDKVFRMSNSSPLCRKLYNSFPSGIADKAGNAALIFCTLLTSEISAVLSKKQFGWQWRVHGFYNLSICPTSQAPALKSCVIVALHLGNNAIGDKGITALADGLRHARGLQKLHLNDNEASSQPTSAPFIPCCCLLCFWFHGQTPVFCARHGFQCSSLAEPDTLFCRPSPPSDATATR